MTSDNGSLHTFKTLGESGVPDCAAGFAAAVPPCTESCRSHEAARCHALPSFHYYRITGHESAGKRAAQAPKT